MSNLGCQTIYRLFNDQPDIVCERAFLPPKQELAALRQSGARIVTIESQTPVADFQTIGRISGLPVNGRPVLGPSAQGQTSAASTPAAEWNAPRVGCPCR